jgi:hypothetical protein
MCPLLESVEAAEQAHDAVRAVDLGWEGEVDGLLEFGVDERGDGIGVVGREVELHAHAQEQVYGCELARWRPGFGVVDAELLVHAERNEAGFALVECAVGIPFDLQFDRGHDGCAAGRHAVHLDPRILVFERGDFSFHSLFPLFLVLSAQRLSNVLRLRDGLRVAVLDGGGG